MERQSVEQSVDLASVEPKTPDGGACSPGPLRWLSKVGVKERGFATLAWMRLLCFALQGISMVFGYCIRDVAKTAVIAACLGLAWTPTILRAQTDKAVQDFLEDEDVASFWFYDDLELGLAKAQASGKPLLVTIRCVPCQACRGMDQAVVNPVDPRLRQLMQQFVCVRIIQAWGLDLSLFQYDMNMSWAAFFLNSDRTIYGRYGTRAAQRNERAITVSGFAEALQGALELHQRYVEDPVAVKRLLEPKVGPKPRWKSPEDNPVIQKTIRWDKRLGRITGPKTASCVHCHFVPAAEMMAMLSHGETIPDKMLWAYPLPETIGMTLDPDARAAISQVEPQSPAAKAGLQRGDEILTFAGQPVLSIADIQWALHQASDRDALTTMVDRAGTKRALTLDLPAGWRRRGEFVERASSWDLFKVKLFGVADMESLSAEEKASWQVDSDQMALRVKKLSPSWAGINHDVRRAGLQAGDVVVQVDERVDLNTHSELLAYLVQEKQSGDQLKLVLLREGRRLQIEAPLNWASRIDALRSP